MFCYTGCSSSNLRPISRTYSLGKVLSLKLNSVKSWKISPSLARTSPGPHSTVQPEAKLHLPLPATTTRRKGETFFAANQKLDQNTSLNLKVSELSSRSFARLRRPCSAVEITLAFTIWSDIENLPRVSERRRWQR